VSRALVDEHADTKGPIHTSISTSPVEGNTGQEGIYFVRRVVFQPGFVG